jgi:hypothetical protein
MKSYTLYLDAAGDPGWPSPFGRSRVEWYVLAGLALDPENDLKAKLETEKVLQQYIPDVERRKWPEKNFEIHYHDLIYGLNVFSHLKDIQRKELSDKIFEIILECKPILFATAINKTQLKRKYGSNAFPPRILAMQSTIHRFSMFLEREKFIGSAMVDEEEYKKDKEVRELVHQLRRSGATIRGMNYQPKKENNLNRVLNAISLSPSEMSTGIQLADICSRSIWSHFEKKKSERFKQLSGIFDKNSFRTFEPSVIPPPEQWT